LAYSSKKTQWFSNKFVKGFYSYTKRKRDWTGPEGSDRLRLPDFKIS
jgi:hypothetical protein